MIVQPPHFLLFSGVCRGEAERSAGTPRWRFVLESVGGQDSIEAVDSEPGVQGERLELLAVVRGLEALDQPSAVTLITPSRYVNSGLRFGIQQWRQNGWRWERFGQRVPIKNADLWQRVDGALRYHDVDCKYWRLDTGDESTDVSDESSSQEKMVHVRTRFLFHRRACSLLRAIWLWFRERSGINWYPQAGRVGWN